MPGLSTTGGMGESVLGLDVGGANLKLAVRHPGGAGAARSAPFALWKQPDALAGVLADLLATEPPGPVALTLTGELCDCFVTKREGVAHIVRATVTAAKGRPVHVWGTDGRFHTPEDAVAHPRLVAAANWHALATWAARRYVPTGHGLLIDVGSTTTDIIPLCDGRIAARGLTDEERLRTGELLYLGARRTPLCAVVPPGWNVMNEFFATMADVSVLQGWTVEDPGDTDTANGRPLVIEECFGRLARMLGGDAETLPSAEISGYAKAVEREARRRVTVAARMVQLAPYSTLITSGSGEVLACFAGGEGWQDEAGRWVRLPEVLGPTLSAAAPAWACAELLAESES